MITLKVRSKFNESFIIIGDSEVGKILKLKEINTIKRCKTVPRKDIKKFFDTEETTKTDKEINLKSIQTCELVDELMLRPGVYSELISPYDTKEFGIEGAAIVLAVFD